MRRHDDGKARIYIPRLSRCGLSSGALRSAHHELHYCVYAGHQLGLTLNGVSVEGLDPTVPSAATSLTLAVEESIASYHDNQCQMAVILSDITLGCVLACECSMIFIV